MKEERIVAEVDYKESEIGVFEPMVVMERLLYDFPEVEKYGGNHLEDTCLRIVELNNDKGIGAVKVALKDLLTRGPALQFRIPQGNKRYCTGIVDRQKITFNTVGEFTPEMKKRIEKFVYGLQMPQVIVKLK